MLKNYREHDRGVSKAGWRIPKGVGSMTRSVFEFELIVVFELIVFDYIFSAVHDSQKCGDRIACPRPSPDCAS